MRMRTWLFGLLLLCLCLAVAAQDDTTCSATKRCKNGCCNKSGNCGFGPDYCGTNCQSDCDRKSECNPGFGSKWAENDKCPLNVCCSKHGYCGTTKDFCGSKKVKKPSCSKTGDVSRVIGYFEGWAKARPCEAFSPEQIPIGLYTHINFAFATIDPKTFEIKPDKESDIRMYKRLTDLKRRDPELKVYIAVGGWTFNDPGPTASTFSDLAASLPRQRAFMKSLVSFMSTYGFDGLDLDWEYPVDTDRGGRAVDFANFPKFMERLKSMMDAADKGLSITLPASYWYLRQFDIKKLEKTVDFFNIMSYDLHGAWDQGKNYTQPFLNAHSNLTEIDLALDLLWRNNIQSDKVVLGMGFYGRAFSVQTGTCTKPGCLFKAAGKAGDCSREKGILLNSEIVTTIKKYNIKPEFYKEEAVKVAKWGNQWVSYDDEDTFKLKTDYAKSRCLGGVMVWAISHDTKEARFNKALALSLNRKTTSGEFDENEKAYDIKKIPNEQCRWTNCKEGCRKGWVAVPRSDSGARKNEIMFDETGCGGDGGHTFCCPAGDTKIPTCGWYGHNNGRCPTRSECPSDMTEIASNEIYCKKKGSKKQNFQTACCKTDVVGTKVYGTCEWGQYPKCDAQEGCPNPLGNKKMGSLLAYSASGSGGGNCDDAKNELGLNVPGVQYRKFCCNDSDKNLRFTDCQKFRNVGPEPEVMPRGFCRSGCPPDRIQVAIDTQVDTCAIAGVGGMAHCCKTDYAEIFEVENPKIDAFENDVKAWIKNPTCPKDDGGLFKRFDPTNDLAINSSISMNLSPRAKEMEDSYDVVILLARLIAGMISKEVAEALTPKWNLVVEEEYPNLVVETLQKAKKEVPEWEDEDAEVMSRVTICDPKRANARIAAILGKGSDGRTLAFNCTNTICQNGVCEPGTPEAARRRRGLSMSRASHSVAHLHYHLHARQAGAEHNEVPMRDRGGDQGLIEYEVPAHDEPKKLVLRNPDAQVVDFANEADCHETRLWYTTWSVSLEGLGFQTEHLIDKVILKRFFSDAGFAVLRSGAQSQYHGIPVRFFEEALRLGRLRGRFPHISGRDDAFDDQNLLTRVFECLGSRDNFRNFVIVVGPINAIKGRVMKLNAPIQLSELDTYDTDGLMSHIRTVITVFEYMGSEERDENGKTVEDKINNIVKNIVKQLVYAQDLWDEEHPGRPVPAARFFVEWLQDYFEEAGTRARAWIQRAITILRNRQRQASGARAEEIRLAIASFESQLSTVRIGTEWDIDWRDDDDEMDTSSG
ncbi:hypothetical protein FVEG_17600 [Fusarium verticillioides 7600]|uniref:chitinase n=1 Tax=Gibberella moniliformis (strain M3125 / FGSC 7600) TaxID=334819 RepID=W7N7U7_GIBM7|nr:hypothetical protein FVEG_17600 [Fusarium verticillioides 7600]XP_018762010.1 hypothetical protein FVEG_17600 [Fusarium verticillioides 7600]RBQ75502.1 hypothetical protein FVER14953_13764 [Fusarium verticillioides]EWG55818.1 hypothetical protein FVEG_17600 [Fusarium verticillioides 7600]EWG55819.1 hypothetical protein FVEG_17600 [Fusarium verticillioides 7600]RBR00288.1 hypothetical protein FVER53263_13764 [Fusarium verticillioides]